MAAVALCGCTWELTKSAESPSRTLPLLRVAAALLLMALAFWHLPRDWHVSATYLLGVAVIYWPSALRKVIDRDSVRRFASLVILLSGTCAAIDVLGWAPTAALAAALAAAWVTDWARQSIAN